MGVGVLELGLALAQRLDLGAGEHDPALEALEQVVAVRRLAVGRDVAGGGFAFASLGHGAQLTSYLGRSTGSRSTRPRGASIRSTRDRDRIPEPDRAAAAGARPASSPCSLSSHQSPRIRRTGSIPSNCGRRRTRRTRRRRSGRRPRPRTTALRSPPANSSRSSRKQRATSSASRSIVIASRSRAEVHGPAAATHDASGAGSPAHRRQQRRGGRSGPGSGGSAR